VAATSLLVGLIVAGLYHYFCSRYLEYVVRIFEEKPLFVIPWGKPTDAGEEVRFQTENGLTLCGYYLRTKTAKRKGVILFGLEYGSKRYTSVTYGQALLAAGYDVFSFETRSQGESDTQPGYEPLQWVTNYEVADYQAALAYLKQRPDADPRGIGFFGISKGAGAGLIAGSRDAYIRCFVTDGVFGTRSTMLPYMRKWVAIVSTRYWLQKVLPLSFYGLIADRALKQISERRSCVFPSLEASLPKLAPRPVLMIQGGNDTYITTEIARSLFKRIRKPKELWVVQGAKHNQSLQVAGVEYASRITKFFDENLGDFFLLDSAQAKPPRASALALSKVRASNAELAATRTVAVEHA
jgi:fermentation-respiration switch protein FrsA (DUF1100 family)